jgi:hypothetical protein
LPVIARHGKRDRRAIHRQALGSFARLRDNLPSHG